jgi:hypothetical protein
MSNSDTDRRRERRIAAGLFAVVAFFVGWAVYHFFKRDIAELVIRNVRGTSREHAGFNWALARCGNETERELATGVIRPGESVEQLLASRQPVEVKTHGPYQQFIYLPLLLCGSYSVETVIVAKNGIVRSAVTTNYMMDGHIFFDTLTPTELKEWSDLQRASVLARIEGDNAVRAAMVGGPGVLFPWELNPPNSGP